MDEKERKRLHYEQHKQEYIERAARWHREHREQYRNILNKAKRRYYALNRESILAKRKQKILDETVDERVERLNKRRVYDTAHRRRLGMKERIRMSDDDRRMRNAKRYRERYNNPERHEKLKAYERERKRAYRARKKSLEFNQQNTDS